MIYKLINKFNKNILVLFLMLLGLISCYDNEYEAFVPPTGNVNNIQPNTLFTTSTSADDTMSFVFRSYSTDADSYLWDFGDGNTSTDPNPDYTFKTGGLYNVKLTTISSDGLTAVDSSNVAPIFVDFNTTQEDTEVTFENISSGVKSLVWDFGDGETLEWNSEEADEDDPNYSPVYIYKTAETFEATLTAITFLDVTVSVSKNITDLVLSTIPDFTFAVSGFTVQFTDASLYAESYSWDFGDGSGITSTDPNPMHTFPGEGTYEVILTTTNEAGVSKSKMQAVPIGGIMATFPAEVLNSDCNDWTLETNDNADAWDMTPNSTVKDNDGNTIDSPYRAIWYNSDLADWLETNCGDGDEQPGSSGDGNKFGPLAGGGRGVKLNESCRRLYQVVAVEPGVEYTFTIDTRSEAEGINTEVFILNTEITSEDGIENFADAYYNITNDFNSSKSSSTNDTFTTTTFTFVASANNAVIYVRALNAIDGSNEVFIDNIDIKTPGFDDNGDPTGVTATFAAEILNGSIDEITGTDLNDNADAFDMTPNSTVKDASGADVASPFTGWKNSTLNGWIEDNISTSNEAPGGSSTANSAPRSLKLHEVQRRAYQPFEVEFGVEYTLKFWVKAEGVGAVTVYIFDNEIEDELTLDSDNLGSLVVTGGVNNSNSFQEYEFTFTATSTTALFYAKPSGAIIDGDNEIWIDDISIETPGF